MSKARILDVTPDQYHRLGGLSSSIAKILLEKTPLHAYVAHPCHGKDAAKVEEEAAEEEPATDEKREQLERGSIIHSMVLGTGSQYEVLDHDEYRTKAARADRDAARAAGKIPLKRKKFLQYGPAAVGIREGLAARGLELDGRSEVAFEWFEDHPAGPVQCRGMADHLWLPDKALVLDLKITYNASLDVVERTAERFGYAIQAAAYTRGLEQLYPDLAGRIEFVFAFVEPYKPFAMHLLRPSGVFRELGERRWLRAVKTWGDCIAADTWPAYPTEIGIINPPPWALAQEGYADDEAA